MNLMTREAEKNNKAKDMDSRGWEKKNLGRENKEG